MWGPGYKQHGVQGFGLLLIWSGVQKFVFVSFSLLIRCDQKTPLIIYVSDWKKSWPQWQVPRSQQLLFRFCAFLEKKHPTGLRDLLIRITFRAVVLTHLWWAYANASSLSRCPLQAVWGSARSLVNQRSPILPSGEVGLTWAQDLPLSEHFCAEVLGITWDNMCKVLVNHSCCACGLLFSELGVICPKPPPSCVYQNAASWLVSSPHLFLRRHYPIQQIEYTEEQRTSSITGFAVIFPWCSVRSGTDRNTLRLDKRSMSSSFVSLEMNNHLILALKGLNFCPSDPP